MFDVVSNCNAVWKPRQAVYMCVATLRQVQNNAIYITKSERFVPHRWEISHGRSKRAGSVMTHAVTYLSDWLS